MWNAEVIHTFIIYMYMIFLFLEFSYMCLYNVFKSHLIPLSMPHSPGSPCHVFFFQHYILLSLSVLFSYNPLNSVMIYLYAYMFEAIHWSVINQPEITVFLPKQPSTIHNSSSEEAHVLTYF